MSNTPARDRLLAILRQKKHENAAINNLVGKPEARHWVDTSAWALKPARKQTFRIGHHVFRCYNVHSHYARISWERAL